MGPAASAKPNLAEAYQGKWSKNSYQHHPGPAALICTTELVAFQDRLPPNSIMAALERAFRTVDVDLYNEDNYKEEADEAISDSVDTDQVNSLLGANKNVDALKTFLSGSPDAAKDPAVKKNYLDLAVRILMAIKQSEMEKAVAGLEDDTRDVLMKFIYRGFEMPVEGSSAQLLVWHEKLFSATGVGSVVRVLTDKRKA